jgi:hypothetical protein
LGRPLGPLHGAHVVLRFGVPDPRPPDPAAQGQPLGHEGLEPILPRLPADLGRCARRGQRPPRGLRLRQQSPESPRHAAPRGDVARGHEVGGQAVIDVDPVAGMASLARGSRAGRPGWGQARGRVCRRPVREGARASKALSSSRRTRSKDGQIKRFKKGMFCAAVRAGVPVVPVAVHGTSAVMEGRGRHGVSRDHGGPGRVYVRIGARSRPGATGRSRDVLPSYVSGRAPP